MANETWNKIKKAVLGDTERFNQKSKSKVVKTHKSKKQIATEKGEPYVEVITLDIDPNNPVQGAFELEWNELFITKLRAEGYTGGTDEDVIDTWFQQVCRNIAIEEWETMPDSGPSTFVTKTNLGDGKSEIS